MTIFIAVRNSIVSMAFLILVLSTRELVCLLKPDCEHQRIPLSVLGIARVTSSVHCSQHTSSSPFANQAFRRLFSKNCTAICPLGPVFLPPPGTSELESSCRTSAAVLWSIRVSSSTSSTTGRVRSKTSRDRGRMEGKNRWKKIVCRIPSGVSWVVDVENKAPQLTFYDFLD